MTWKPIPGWPYEVSDNGEVRRIGKTGLLHPVVTPKGYRRIMLTRERKWRNFWVHRLVLEAFVGPIPVGCQTNHINGVKSDNRLANLEYVTPRANMAHASANGLTASRKSGWGKLTEAQVAEIRATSGKRSAENLAQQFGVSTGLIYTLRSKPRGLTSRQIDVLHKLATFQDREAFWRPLDIGGHSRSHHFRSLARLVQLGLVERKRRRVGISGGSWTYRITELGLVKVKPTEAHDA